MLDRLILSKTDALVDIVKNVFVGAQPKLLGMGGNTEFLHPYMVK